MQLDWSEQAAHLIRSMETSDFPRLLSKSLRAIADFDYTVIFGYVGTARPMALYDDFPPDRKRLHVDEYLEGPYLLDPFFLASTGTVAPGLWRLSEIAPDRFYQGEYWRSYYGQTGLAEEVGFLIDINEALTVVVSLMRKSRKFSKSEIRALRAVYPVVEAACQKNWRLWADTRDPPVQEMEENIERAFRRIGEGVLTGREREVVEHTLRGHSADAIGKLLGISPGTVRIHRRNIYSKLRINSQGELFSEFISAIVETQPLSKTQ
jgi:DNA-binding CsgD family transcriptional regulator